jgi:hypothetical protein
LAKPRHTRGSGEAIGTAREERFLARDLTLDTERKSLRFGVAALIEERREGR